MGPNKKRVSKAWTNVGRSLDILTGHHTMNEAGHYNVAGTMAKGDETLGLLWPQHLHLHQTTGSRVTEVHCQLLHQCHQDLIDLGALVINTMADATRNPEATWESHLQGWRQERCHHLSKLALGYNVVLSGWVPRPHPPPHVICSLQDYPGELVRSSGTDITLDCLIAVLDELYNNVKALDTCNQEHFQLWMADKETVSDWQGPSWCTSKSLWLHSQKGSCWTTLLNWSETTSTVGYLSGCRWWWPTSRQLLKKSYLDYLWVAQEAEKE